MTPRLQKLNDFLVAEGFSPAERLGELTIEVPAAQYRSAAEKLKAGGFEQLIDLCGLDYATYGDRPREGKRFAVVVHLLSIQNNVRLRVRALCADDSFPVVASLVEVWPAAGWFEREAFDLVRIQGMTQTEAAQVLGVSAMTVKRRLQRSLRLLSEALSDLRPGQPMTGSD